MKLNSPRTTLTGLFVSLNLLVFSQTQEPAESVQVNQLNYSTEVGPNGYKRCATMEADSMRRAINPNMPTLQEEEIWLQQKILEYKANNQDGNAKKVVITLPVVVHVIHNGDPIGQDENISNDQILSQIQVLNEDFRRMIGTNGANTHTDGADVEIEFCMAIIDPNGAPTDGIDRVQQSSASFSGLADVDAIKPNSIWNPDNYLNMWVVNYANSGLLGFAQFPDNSGLGGLNATNGNANTDGVVADYRAFGSSQIFPAGTYDPPYDLGRTMTHELGHWFGLRHIWGDSNCGDDFCGDTPESSGSNFSCNVQTTCDGIQDMVENYMDYTDDACMNIFTEDQKTRMLTVMTVSPRRASLIASAVTVCQGSSDPGTPPPSPTDPDVPETCSLKPVNIFTPNGDGQNDEV